MIQQPMSKSESLIGKYAIMMRGRELKADLEGQASKQAVPVSRASHFEAKKDLGNLRSGPDIAEPAWMNGWHFNSKMLAAMPTVCVF